MIITIDFSKNVIPELISDDLYEKLYKKEFFDKTAIRNYIIKKEYQKIVVEEGINFTKKKEKEIILELTKNWQLGISSIEKIIKENE